MSRSSPDDRSYTSCRQSNLECYPPETSLRRWPHGVPCDRPGDRLFVASDGGASDHTVGTDTALSSAPRCSAGTAPGHHLQLPPSLPCPNPVCRNAAGAHAGVPAISAAPRPSKPSGHSPRIAPAWPLLMPVSTAICTTHIGTDCWTGSAAGFPFADVENNDATPKRRVQPITRRLRSVLNLRRLILFGYIASTARQTLGVDRILPQDAQKPWSLTKTPGRPNRRVGKGLYLWLYYC